MTPTATPSLGRTLPADRFHTGVRVVAMVLWFAIIILVYVLLQVLAAAVGISTAGVGVLIVIVLAVLVAQPLAFLAERQLMRRWPSGRAMELQSGALVWRDKGRAVRLNLHETVNYWRWRFVIKRRRGGRVPSGHHTFALRLVQGDDVVTVYTFLTPALADALAAKTAFYELRRPSEQGKLALGGRDAMFLTAEHARWESGAELDPADFQALIDHLTTALPEFGREPASGI
jgi:hypothetical protein